MCGVKSCVLPVTKRVLFSCFVVVEVKEESQSPDNQQEVLVLKKGNLHFSFQMFSALLGSPTVTQDTKEALKFVESLDKREESGLLSLKVLNSGNGGPLAETGEDGVFQCLDLQSLTKEKKMLKDAAGFGNLETEALFELYVECCWPRNEMDYDAFARFMTDYTEFSPLMDLRKTFRALKIDSVGECLPFGDFVVGMGALQLCTPHGRSCGHLRTRYIFAYYTTQGLRGIMNQEEQLEMLCDVVRLRTSKLSRMSKAEIVVEASTLMPYQDSFNVDNMVTKVGQMELRGTSALFRLSQKLFPDLRRKLELGMLKKEAWEPGSPSPKRRRLEDHLPPPLSPSPSPSPKKYSVSRHSLTFSSTSGPVVKDVQHLEDLEDCLTQSAQVEMERLPQSQPSSSSGAGSLLSPGVVDAEEMLRGLDYFDKPYIFPEESGRKGKKRGKSWTGVSKPGLAQCFINVANTVKDIVRNEPVCVPLSSPAYILGDLHGNYKDLMAFEESLWRLGPRYCPANLLFLGDYVDRGQWSFEIIANLFAQKVLCPDKVWLLRGNHELRFVQRHFSFETECVQKFGQHFGARVWRKANEVFDVLPLAALLDGKIFCVHGGIPHPRNVTGPSLVESINAVQRPLPFPQSGGLVWDLLWNDPEWTDMDSAVLDDEGFGKNVKRGNARVFSSEALGNFLSAHSLSHVIRAHQVQQEGFQLRYSARLLTVFSSSSYVGMDNGAACVMAEKGKLKVLRIQRDSKAPPNPSAPAPPASLLPVKEEVEEAEFKEQPSTTNKD